MKLNDLLVFANAIFTSKYNPDLLTDLSMWSLPAEPVLLRQTVEKSRKILCVMVEIFCQALSSSKKNLLQFLLSRKIVKPWELGIETETARKVGSVIFGVFGSVREMKYLNEFQNLVVQIIFFSLHQETQFCFFIKLGQNKNKLSR